MDLLVCVKQVLDTDGIKIDPDTNEINKSGASNIVSPYDKNALEAAVQLKETAGGTVTVISLGSSEAKKALKECISVGADKAVLISDEVFSGSDAYATGLVLTAAIKKLGQFDLILCGEQATDNDDGQVGTQIAEHLGIPQVTCASKIEIKDGKAIVNKETDEGYMVIETKLPALCTTGDSINEPRFATIKSKMAANRAKIEVLKAADLGIETDEVGTKGSPTQILKVFAPPRRKTGIKIQEESDHDTALKLVQNMVAAKLV